MVYIVSRRVHDTRLRKEHGKSKNYHYFYLCKSERNKDKVSLRTLAYLGKELPSAKALETILKKKKIKTSAQEILHKFREGKRRKHE